MSAPKILFYDIETTDLDADFGNMIAFGYRVNQGPPRVLSLLDFAPVCFRCGRVDAVDDAPLLRAAHAVLSVADMWITWYGKQFDAPYIVTRALDAGLPPLPPIPHVDLYWCARNNLKLSNNRLANVQNFLRLPTVKTPLTKRMWRRAQAGHVPSIRYIIRHCRLDVSVLAEAYAKLRPYVRQHPRIRGADHCRVCGSARIQRRGVLVTVARGRQVRLRCTTCGHWEQRAALKGEVE